MEQPLKKTALFDAHVKAGAKMVPFAGFMMPLEFEGISKEHIRVRTKVGIFDVSHMGEIRIKGKEALAYVQKLVTNDCGRAKPGKAVYTPVCLPSGGIVDDMIVYKFGDDDFFICVNAANREKDYNWFVSNRDSYDCEIVDQSDEYSQVAVQGPNAKTLLSRIFGDDVLQMKPFWFCMKDFQGAPCILATTGYTGEEGGEVYVPNEVAQALWYRLLEVGEDLGVGPIGLGARDTLRLEMKYCLYGHDIDETTTPLEADIGWTVKFDKGDFIGRDALVAQKEKGISRRLSAFIVVEKGVPRQGYRIVADNEEVGQVTSGAFSPCLKKPIGLGYIKKGFDEVGKQIFVDIKGFRVVKAMVVEAPFYRRGTC
jgi:aminomethyltransferase